LKSTKRILVGVCLFVLSISAWSQNLNRPPVPGIPGYLDPRTGAFRPMPVVTDSEDPTPFVTPTTGKIVLTLTVALVSTFPTTEAFSCGLTATASDTSGLTFIDSELIAATKAGGNLTCTITLNYSWALATPTVDHMIVEYTINGAVGTAGLPTRLADHGVAAMTVPASGKTTMFTLSTAI
jgi:hypothetical protein